MKIWHYYQLVKPGIVFGNAVTASAGFFLASKGQVDFYLFSWMLFGLSAVVASGCVLNNYFDRLSDRTMARTKKRPLAQGLIPLFHAICFGVLLLILGIFSLFFFTTKIASLVAAVGFILYVGFYTFWKYHTVYGTELGSLAGAIPPVVGYVAVTGRVDLEAALLFSIVALWQMPHFFAIAIYRMEEYACASIPVSPLKRGIPKTKWLMLWYLAAFFLAAYALAALGHVGISYLIAMTLLGLYWIRSAWKGFWAKQDKRWARQMFVSSLVVILGWATTVSLSH